MTAGAERGGRNRWGTFKHSLVLWYASFPSRTWSSPSTLFEFVEAVCEIGEREEVYSVREAPHPDGFDRDRDGTWPAHARRLWEEGRSRTLFPDGGPFPANAGGLRVAARLSAFAESSGEIADHEVVDAGELLTSLRPDLAGQHIPRVCPVQISGPVTIDPSWTVDVSFTLATDIWFPWVVGIFDDDGDDYGLHDNRALASHHTPRLNRFLRSFREEAVARGAEWGFDEHAGAVRRYARLVDENGVMLGGREP